MRHDGVKKIKFQLATKFGWLFILLMGKLTRIRVIGYSRWKKVTESGRGVLVTIWHGRILLPIYMHRNMGITPMVSLHDDGEMISQTVYRLGYLPIRGSSSKGGKKAFQEMLRTLKRGKICTIMPDGPRGPRHSLKHGTIHLASRSGAYILPLTFSSRPLIQARSWDRFVIWKPFAKSVMLYGEPITVPRNLSEEEVEKYRLYVQEQMIRLEEKADAYFRK